MKKIKTISLCICAALLFGCASKEAVEDTIDYDDSPVYLDEIETDVSEVQTDTTDDDSDEVKFIENDSSNYDAYEDDSNSYEDNQEDDGFFGSLSEIFRISDKRFIQFGRNELNIPNMLGNLGQKKADSTYIEGTDLIGFGVYENASYYYLLLDKADRLLLRKAADQYFSDFANKKLKRKGNTSKAYGEFSPELYFGSIKAQAKNYSYPRAYFGYKFKDGSPYFMISCAQAPNQKRAESDIYPETSNYVSFYFTKAQLTELLNVVIEENINKYLKNTSVQTVTEKDEY